MYSQDVSCFGNKGELLAGRFLPQLIWKQNVKGTLRGPLHIRRSFKTTIVRQFGLVVAAPDAELADAWPISRPYLSPLKKISFTAGVPSFADEAE